MSRQLITVAALALAGVACASRQSSDRAPPETPDPVVIDAVNDHFYEARVHAVYTGGQRRSLGTIAGNGGRTQQTIAWEPRPLVFEIMFIIDGAEYASYPVDVTPGQHVAVRLPPNIQSSGLFRRLRRT